jgi:LPXTG-motif cell wall-anchored protein
MDRRLSGLKEAKMMRTMAPMLFLLALLLIVPDRTFAHAEIVGSNPAAGATLDAAPTTVTAVFSQSLGPDGSTMTVVEADGTRVDLGDAKLDPSDVERKTMVVSLKPGLSAGTYTVNWTTLSADDGEETAGSFTFTISQAGDDTGSGPSPAASPRPTASPGPDVADKETDEAATLPATGTTIPSRFWVVTGGLLISVGGLLLRRRHVRA